MDARFARKAIPVHRLEDGIQTPLCMCLLRVMFGNPADGDTQALEGAGIKWEGPDYSPKEFAAYAQRSPWSIYKWLDPDGTAHFPATDLFEFVAFVNAKSGGTDLRLALYIADLSGFADRVRKIMDAVEGRI